MPLCSLAWRRMLSACRALKRETGQDLAEYALLMALIVVAVIVAVATFGGELQSLYSYVCSHYVW